MSDPRDAQPVWDLVDDPYLKNRLRQIGQQRDDAINELSVVRGRMQSLAIPSEDGWRPHLDYAGESMREGEFRDAPISADGKIIEPPPALEMPEEERKKEIAKLVAEFRREHGWHEERERLRAALEVIDEPSFGTDAAIDEIRGIARAALSEPQEQGEGK